MVKIHATALVDPGAKLGTNVEIGPFCVIGPRCRARRRRRACIRMSCITGRTTIGAGCTDVSLRLARPHARRTSNFTASRARSPSARTRRSASTSRSIPAPSGGHMATKVGANCLLMIGAHIAHDCEIGDNVIAGQRRDAGRPCHRSARAPSSAASRAVHQYRAHRRLRLRRRHVRHRRPTSSPSAWRSAIAPVWPASTSSD